MSIMYFPLALVYKLFGKYEPNDLSYIDEYWINSYWFITSTYFSLIFTNLIKYCDIEERITKKIYKWIIKSVAIYWGIMAALRLYLFFNIGLYKKLISSANTLTIGGVVIFIIVITITARYINDTKNER